MSKTLTKREQRELEVLDAQNYLRELFADNDKPVIGTILRHVSSSGMSRDISLYYKDTNITYSAALAMGDKVKSSNGFNAIRVSGCGMDMGFHLVYNLSLTLYGHDNRGGYKLSQRWL
jgi:hypothetical protein